MMRRLESGAWALFLAMSRALQMGGPRLVTAIAHWAVSVHRSQGRRWLAAGMASLALTVVIMGANGISAPRVHADGQAVVGPFPPALLNGPQLADKNGLFYATDAEQTALSHFENQAVHNTLSDHGLPATDDNAVLSWGREDAEAELWGLMKQAITASPRTADQQSVVDWLGEVAYREGLLSGYYTGLEYVKWAGLGQGQYQSLVTTYDADYLAKKDTSTDKTNLQNFLTQDPLTYNGSSAATSSGGYCVYKSPAPYQSDYTSNIYGSNIPVECTPAGATACEAGCVPPIPTAAQFEKWGAADANSVIVGNPSFTDSAVNIAYALEVEDAVGTVAAGVTISLAATGALAGTAFEAAVFPFASISLFALGNGVTAGAWVTPLAGAVAASGVAAIVGAVLLFIVGTTLQVMNLLNVSDTQNDVTKYVEGVVSNPYDPASMLNDTNEAGELYSIFVAATLPAPPPASDTTAMPFPATNCLGSTVDASGYLVDCLNPPPPPAQNPQTDPMFVVTPNGGTAGPDQTTLDWYDKALNVTNSAYLSGSGGWFVDTVTLSDGTQQQILDTDRVARPLQQSLRIHYTDWSGTEQVATLVNVPGKGYEFASINQTSGGAKFNPTTCVADKTCDLSSSIKYIDSSGNEFSASVVPPPLPKIWGTDVFGTTEGTTGGIPMSLEANASSPINSPLTYSWQIEDKPLVSNVNICTTGGTDPTPIPCPPPTVTVYGNLAPYAFPTSGNFNVTLTVTDADGRYSTDNFTVSVTDVAPSLSFGQPCSPFLVQFGCGIYAEPLGAPTTLEGVIGHAGSEDVESLDISWGDGTPDSKNTNASCIDADSLLGESNCPGAPISFMFSNVYSVGDTFYIPFNSAHTYAKPGAYTVTAKVTDQSGAVSTRTTTEEVGPTTTTLTTSPNPSVWGQQVTLTASVSSPTGGNPSGTVSFSAGSATISGCSAQPVNTTTETATCLTSALAVSASDSLTATYSGDSSFAPSQSAPATQSVNKAATATQVKSNANPAVWGQSVTLTATISPTAPGSGNPSGTVAFKDGANTISGCGAAQVNTATETATCITSALSVTSHAITAIYSGDANFTGSSSSPLTQVVNKANVTATVTSTSNVVTHGQPVTFTAQVTAAAPGAGTPTGTVTFMDGSTALGTVSLTMSGGAPTASLTTSSLAAGAHSITVVYNGDGNFLGGSSAKLTQYVNNDLSAYPKLASGGYNLSNMNLTNGSFVGENLSGSTLYNGKFLSAYFISANLSGANLSDTNFTGANFTGANLTNANLSKANLTSVIGLSSATLTGVNWNGATCPDGTLASNHGGTCVGHF
jgi:hypothetical protein